MKNTSSILFLFLLLFMLNPLHTFAQFESEGFKKFNEERIEFNKRGMLILGSWAVGNMAWGGIMAGNSTGQERAFHQMNIYWNSVNLIIAGFGYYSAIREEASSDFWETQRAQQQIEKVLLLNTGLDLAYIGGGLWMLERGRRLDDEVLRGFGQSVMLQGAFLMTFDLVKFLIHNRHAKQLPKIFEQVHLHGNGLSFRMTF